MKWGRAKGSQICPLHLSPAPMASPESSRTLVALSSLCDSKSSRKGYGTRAGEPVPLPAQVLSTDTGGSEEAEGRAWEELKLPARSRAESCPALSSQWQWPFTGEESVQLPSSPQGLSGVSCKIQRGSNQQYLWSGI